MVAPLIVGGTVLGVGALVAIGKDLGWWGKTTVTPSPHVIPPPGVTSDGHPIMTGDAAKDMNAMLKWTGYRMIDMPVYKAFQASAGLTVDGYPGLHTMQALKTVLQTKGVQQQDVYAGPVYAFLKGPGFDGVNAPTAQAWARGMPPSHPATTNPPGPQAEAGGMPHPDVGGGNAVLTSTGYVSPAAALAGAGGQVLDASEAAQQAALAGARSGVLAEIEATAKAAEAAVGG